MGRHLLLAIACLAAHLPAARPNILHIHADDHRPDGLGALGTKGLITPNLDSIVARGMTFTRAYTQGSMIGAVCTPSRTMMLTGRSWQRIPGAPAALPDALPAFRARRRRIPHLAHGQGRERLHRRPPDLPDERHR
jgi:arylsulfatase A-like enzyme